MTYGRAKAQDFEVPPRQTAHTPPSAPFESECMPAVRSEASSPTGYARVAATIRPEKSLLDAKPRGKASMLTAILMSALVR